MRNYKILKSLSRELFPLMESSRLSQCEEFLQHGDTTVLLHCIAVAYFSLLVIRILHLRCNEKSLIRGALLHDYFLYDWHTPDPSHRLHGFHHPEKALSNARQDVGLTPMEEDIIIHHMFPLTRKPPKSREAKIVCLVDKGCGLYETLGRGTYPGLRRLMAYQPRSLQKNMRVHTD